MKKILAFIMAFLVLGFSMIPCADASVMPEAENAMYSVNPSESEDHEGEDECSPFCICNCCSGFSLNTSLPVLIQPPFSYNLSYTSFIEARTHSIALPIWQPPQLT